MDNKDKEKIAAIIQFIKSGSELRIEAIKKATEKAIAHLSFLANTFELADQQRQEEMTPPTLPAFPHTDKVNKRSSKSKDKASARKRMEAALATLPEKFTRNELRDRVNSDGRKLIKDGTFSTQFSKLLKRGKVQVVQANVGKKPGIYGKGQSIGQAQLSVNE